MTPSYIVRTVFAALCLAALCETTGGNLQADEPKGELAGVVVDLDGHPVANAKVWLETRPPAAIVSTTTSSDGRFHLGPLPATFRRTLLVDAPGFGREHRDNVSVFPGTVNDLRLVVAAGRTVEGRILKVDGQPAAHAAVTCQLGRVITGRYLSEPLGPEIQVATDAQGRFRVEQRAAVSVDGRP